VDDCFLLGSACADVDNDGTKECVGDREGKGRRRERRDGKRRVTPGELFVEDRVGDRRAVLAAAAELGGQLGVDEAELPGLGEELLGDLRLLVTVAGEGAHRLVGELVQGIADDVLLFGGLE